MKRGPGILCFGFCAAFSLQGLLTAAPYDSDVKAIDKEVLAIERQQDQFSMTTRQSCSGDACTDILFYWDKDGQIRKIIDTVGATDIVGVVRARFFSHCRLILTRQAPDDKKTVKNLKKVEKYYFRKGKLLRITYGDEVQTFGPDQTDYYRRTLGDEAVDCAQKQAK